MPIPHVVEHSVHAVVCGKQPDLSSSSDMGRDTISVMETEERIIFLNFSHPYDFNFCDAIFFLPVVETQNRESSLQVYALSISRLS